ncbi:hypothetical protein Tco_1198574, partial [Tanacetum coccineum]
WVSNDEPEVPEEAPQSLDHAPPSPDYVPDPEHPPSPDYVPGSKYPEYLVSSDDDEDPKEDPEEDPADYPTNGGDDEEEESFGDDDDEEEDDEASREEEEEEEEHLALDNSSMLPAIDHTRLLRAQKTVRPQPPMTASAEALIAEYASTPTPPSPPPSPLSPWSSPLPQIPSPPLHVLSPTLPLPAPPTHTSPLYADALLGYRAAMIRSRAALPPLLLPSTAYRDDIPEADMLLRKRAHFTTPDSRVDYGFVDTVDASIHASESRAMTAIGEVNDKVTDLATTQR